MLQHAGIQSAVVSAFTPCLRDATSRAKGFSDQSVLVFLREVRRGPSPVLLSCVSNRGWNTAPFDPAFQFPIELNFDSLGRFAEKNSVIVKEFEHRTFDRS